MRRTIQSAWISCLLSAVLAVAAAAAPTVVATHAVFAEFAQTIGGDRIEVRAIIPSGFCPGHYDLRPSDFAAVVGADIILYSGFEAWIETLAKAAGDGVAVVALPGEWNTPLRAADHIERIRQALAGSFPELAEEIDENARSYTAELRALGDELQARAAAAGVASASAISIAWQAEFVAWLGISVAGTYGVPESLSVKDLVRLADAGRAVSVDVVVDNLQSGVQFGAKLAREIGAVHVVLSNFPGAMPGTPSVMDLLRANAEALLSAIEPLEAGE